MSAEETIRDPGFKNLLAAISDLIAQSGASVELSGHTGREFTDDEGRRMVVVSASRREFRDVARNAVYRAEETAVAVPVGSTDLDDAIVYPLNHTYDD